MSQLDVRLQDICAVREALSGTQLALRPKLDAFGAHLRCT